MDCPGVPCCSLWSNVALDCGSTRRRQEVCKQLYIGRAAPAAVRCRTPGWDADTCYSLFNKTLLRSSVKVLFHQLLV